MPAFVIQTQGGTPSTQSFVRFTFPSISTQSVTSPLQIELLAHATSVIEATVKASPLCRGELCAVSAVDIESGERIVMEGLNYEFRCHHPIAILRDLVTNVLTSLPKEFKYDGRENSGRPSSSTNTDYVSKQKPWFETAVQVAGIALVHTNITFLFAPDVIAFSIFVFVTKVVVESHESIHIMKSRIEDILASRSCHRSEESRTEFSRNVNAVILTLLRCPYMEPMYRTPSLNTVTSEQHAQELCAVLRKVSTIRQEVSRKKNNNPDVSRKRSRQETDFGTSLLSNPSPRKHNRVTPTVKH